MYALIPRSTARNPWRRSNTGDTLEMIFDNPSSAETIVQMIDQGGHDLVEKKNEGGKIIFKIQKG